MNYRYRHWLFITAAGISIFTVVLVCLSYILDPYGLNNKFTIEGLNKDKLSEKRLVTYKLTHVRNGSYRNIIIGTSRAGRINAEAVSKYLGGATFNLALAGSNTEEQFGALRYAMKFNDVKNVLYGVDMLSINGKKHIEEYVQQKERIESFENLARLQYLSIDSVVDAAILIYRNLTGTSRKQDPGPGTNNTLKIEKYIKGYISSGGPYNPFEFSEEYMRTVKEIKRLCDDNGVRLFVFILPVHYKHFSAIYAVGLGDEFERFKRELARVTDYRDFTGYNTMTANDDNFTDSSHLKTDVAEIVVARVLADNGRAEIPQDFGFIVTRNNIDAHLLRLRSQVGKIDIERIMATEFY